MFELKGVLLEKFGTSGHVIRMKGLFTQNLNTEDGVVRFIQEQRPFAELTVSTIFGEDKTEYFLSEVKKADGKA